MFIFALPSFLLHLLRAQAQSWCWEQEAKGGVRVFKMMLHDSATGQRQGAHDSEGNYNDMEAVSDGER
ncbi:hypothetical protein BHE74_00050843 [Ensete ventricosum]|nr:hypothetical protein BHE74_00050843 [Ensete ventricosum]